jgi:hypothetical protein
LPGLTINSAPYREALLAGDLQFHNILMTFIAYTLTNTAILCCLAGLLGAAAHRLLNKETDKKYYPIFSGIMRGFVVYLLLLAGVYAATSDPFTTTTPEQYVRMAGTVSLLSFLVNYEPNLFQSLINLANKRTNEEELA